MAFFDFVLKQAKRTVLGPAGAVLDKDFRKQTGGFLDEVAKSAKTQTKFIKSLPQSGKEFTKGTRDVAVDTARDVARIPFRIGAEFTPNKQIDPVNDSNIRFKEALQLLVGKEPIKTYGDVGKETIAGFGGSEETANKFGPLAGAAFLGMDLIPSPDDAAKSGIKQFARQAPNVGKGVKKADDFVEQGSKFLPETNKNVSKTRKVFTSVRSQFNELGDEGKQLAKGFENARDIEETFNAGVLNAIPTVLKLSKFKNRGKFEEFVDTLETLRKNPTMQIGESDLDPLVKQAVQEWSGVAPKIRNIANEAGVNVGDLGPYYFPKNYGDIFKNQNSINKAANDMVKNGQAKTTAEALNILSRAKRTHSKPFGNLEMNRILDLPDFKKSPDVLTDYIQGASRRISMARQFGANDEKAFELIDALGKKGYSADRAKELYEVAAGIKEYSPGLSKASSGVRKFNALRSLGTASLANIGQSTNTATVSGIWNTAKAIKKSFNKADREFVDSAGTVADSVLREVRDQAGFGSGIVGKISSPFFGTVEKFNRRVSTIAGAQWADKLAKKAAKGDANAADLLKTKLGIKGEIGETLTDAQKAQAGRKLTEITQFKTGAQDLPAWAQSPEGKLAMQFRTFAYKQTGFMYKEVLQQAAKGNVAPLTRFLAVGIPAGYALSKARDKVKGRDSEDESLAKEIFDAVGNVGGFGLGGDVKFLTESSDSAKFPAYLAGSVAGPTAGLAMETAMNIGGAVQGKPKNLGRQAVKSVPVVGPYVQNKLLPYDKYSGKQKENLEAAKKRGASAETIKRYEDYYDSIAKKKDELKKRKEELKKRRSQ